MKSSKALQNSLFLDLDVKIGIPTIPVFLDDADDKFIASLKPAQMCTSKAAQAALTVPGTPARFLKGDKEKIAAVPG